MITTNKDLFQTSREKVARILADRYDVNVYFEGDACCTEGRNIYLPALNEENCDEEFLDAMDGMLDHEAGHLIFTEFGVMGAAKDQYTRFWLNVVEDARIEERMAELWRGTARNLRRCEEWATKRLIEDWDDFADFTKMSKAAILYAKRGEEAVRLLPDSDELLKQIEPLIPALMIATEVPDTHHALALAKFIVSKVGRTGDVSISLPPEHLARYHEAEEALEGMIEEATDAADESGDASVSGEAEKGEESEGDASMSGKGDGSGSSGEGEATETASGGGLDGEKDPGKAPEKDASHMKGSDRELKEAEDATTKALSREISKEAAATKSRPSSDSDYLIYTTAGDSVKVVPDGSRAQIAKDLKDVRRASGTLMRQLKSVLLSRSRTHNEYDKQWGKLNNKAIPRLLTSGYNRVFKQRSFGEKLNARISLVIDQSGSMQGSNIVEARRCAVLFGEFCHQLSIPFEIFGFTTKDYNTPDQRFMKATREEQARYHRWGNLRIDVFKNFHEDWKKTAHRLSHVEASLHNYDGEAVKIATQRLLLARQDPSERLVMFVLSDGLPEQQISQHRAAHCRYLRRMIEESGKRGVECIGIGIQAAHVKEYYPSHIVIDDPSALQGAQIQKLKEVLQVGKGHRMRRRVG